VHTYKLAPNSAAAAGKVWRRRQPNFGRRRSAHQPDLVRASRKTDGGAAEGLALGGWLVTYRNKCLAPGLNPDTVAHLSTYWD